ncbi:hypothetical protein [Variovorax sp. GT1P44]|uniref:LexA family protein n=1 Tax=Variovorax sp. GT1P44 TaxID=3443742 RepID=UPI003F48EF10
MGRRISPVQKMIFGYMQEFFAENDQLPPLKAIASNFRYAGPQCVTGPLKALERLGYIERNAVGKYRFKREAANA